LFRARLRDIQPALSTAGAARMAQQVFEVTGPGFDGSSDATDDQVFWVAATREELIDAIGPAVGFSTVLAAADDSDIDY
jgi:hypothetical protein